MAAGVSGCEPRGMKRMWLSPLNHPARRSAAERASAPAATAVPARLSAAGAGPGVDVGVVVHLWSTQAASDGKALCGARPSGIFRRWQPRPGEPVSCVKCLAVQAEEDATDLEPAAPVLLLEPFAGAFPP